MMAVYEAEVPAEKFFLYCGRTQIQGTDMPCFQRNVPYIQVSDVPKKWFCEISPKGVLVLTQDKNTITVYIPVHVCTRARVFPVSVHIDSPVIAHPTPCDTDVMPCTIICKGGLVWKVFSVDYEGQVDTALRVHSASQLELIGQYRCSVGEDC